VGTCSNGRFKATRPFQMPRQLLLGLPRAAFVSLQIALDIQACGVRSFSISYHQLSPALKVRKSPVFIGEFGTVPPVMFGNLPR
jgi:hypothetical protein